MHTFIMNEVIAHDTGITTGIYPICMECLSPLTPSSPLPPFILLPSLLRASSLLSPAPYTPYQPLPLTSCYLERSSCNVKLHLNMH